MTGEDCLLTSMCFIGNKTYKKKTHSKKKIKTHSINSKTHISHVMKILTNFISCCGNVFIKMSTWIAEKDSVKRHYRQRRNFTATWQ